MSNAHTDVEHMQEFRDRWEYVHGATGRPNGMTFAKNQGRWYIDPAAPDAGLWLPSGTENVDYMFTSDHNRSSIPFNAERIGTSKRMINGGMRSYHVADKLSTTVSWTDLPSRAYSTLGGYSDWLQDPRSCAKFTVDGGAGGVELLRWWQSHHGSFWVFFSIDAVPVQIPNTSVFQGYARVYEMQISDFKYEVSKRGAGMQSDNVAKDMYYLDLWDVSMTLEEV